MRRFDGGGETSTIILVPPPFDMADRREPLMINCKNLTTAAVLVIPATPVLA